MSAMIARTLKSLDKLKSVENPAAVLGTFNDGKSIAPFAVEPVSSLVSQGIILGSNGKFLPRNKANRAETAVATYRLFKMQSQGSK
jgi:hypothetical protein